MQYKQASIKSMEEGKCIDRYCLGSLLRIYSFLAFLGGINRDFISAVCGKFIAISVVLSGIVVLTLTLHCAIFFKRFYPSNASI